MSSTKADSVETNSVDDDGKGNFFFTNFQRFTKILKLPGTGGEAAASKDLWKKEKKMRFLIRRCCKVNVITVDHL